MADFAVWATAAEAGLGLPQETFVRALERNQASSTQTMLDSDHLPGVVRKLLTNSRGLWEGTASDLLAQLRELAGEPTLRTKEWPRTPSSLSNKLRRLAPALRKAGVEFAEQSRTGSKRGLTLSLNPTRGANDDGASAQSAVTAVTASRPS